MILQDSSPPAFSIGKERRLSQVKQNVNLGPASYSPQIKVKNNPPKFSMGHKLTIGSSFSKPNLIVPEPGRYTPKMESSSIKRTAPSFKIGNA